MLETTVFSIDNAHDFRTMARFMRYVDTHRAMGDFKGTVLSCIGEYKGVMEPSFMMLTIDYDKYIKGSGYLTNQESVLKIPGDSRQPCHLEFKDGTQVILSKSKLGKGKDGWTYILSEDKYFHCEVEA